MQQQQQQQQASSSSSSTLRFQDPLRWVILSYLSVQFEVCGLLIFIFIQHYIYYYYFNVDLRFLVVLPYIFLTPRVLHAATTPGGLRRPGSWVPCITSPYSLSESARTARAAPVPAIWSEERSAPRIVARSAQSAEGRAKSASIRIGERYTAGTTSVLRAAREG